jgi:hypothetical protein
MLIHDLIRICIALDHAIASVRLDVCIKCGAAAKG